MAIKFRYLYHTDHKPVMDEEHALFFRHKLYFVVIFASCQFLLRFFNYCEILLICEKCDILNAKQAKAEKSGRQRWRARRKTMEG